MDSNLIFLHIPKNGGTTFHSILYSLFPIDVVFNIVVIDKVGLNTDDFINLPDNQRKKIKLLKGHMIFGLHQYLYGDSCYVTFLRYPLDRIVSYYNYVLSKSNHRLHDKVMNGDMSLYDFALLLNKEGDGNNGQIRWISGLHDKAELMLEKALENIENHFPIVGLLEKFDESLILLKDYFQWQLPYYQIQNKSKKEVNFDQLDNKTIELIKELNQGDYMLYSEMEKRFNSQVHAMGTRKFNYEVYKYTIAKQLYNQPLVKSIGKTIRPFFTSLNLY